MIGKDRGLSENQLEALQGPPSVHPSVRQSPKKNPMDASLFRPELVFIPSGPPGGASFRQEPGRMRRLRVRRFGAAAGPNSRAGLQSRVRQPIGDESRRLHRIRDALRDGDEAKRRREPQQPRQVVPPAEILLRLSFAAGPSGEIPGPSTNDNGGPPRVLLVLVYFFVTVSLKL